MWKVHLVDNIHNVIHYRCWLIKDIRKMETVIICSCVGITVSLLRFNYNQHLNMYIEDKQSPFLHESREEEIAFVMAFGGRCMSECDTHE